jgi:hypothetical protein
MISRCTEHDFVIEDDIVEGLIDQQEEHIFHYHTDYLRDEGLDAIRKYLFVMHRAIQAWATVRQVTKILASKGIVQKEEVEWKLYSDALAIAEQFGGD